MPDTIQNCPEAEPYLKGYENARHAWLSYLSDKGYKSELTALSKDETKLKNIQKTIEKAYYPLGLDTQSLYNADSFSTLHYLEISKLNDLFDTYGINKIFHDVEKICNEIVIETSGYTLLNGKVIQNGNPFWLLNPRLEDGTIDLKELIEKELEKPSLGDVAQESRTASQKLGDNTQTHETNIKR